MKKASINEVLPLIELHNGNISAIARHLGVSRVTGQHIDDGSAIDWIRRALGEQGAEVAPF